MRAFTLYEPATFSYPDDMKMILEYLQWRGRLHVSPKTVEKYYFEFSEEKYAAGWIGVNLVTLEEFALWLARKVI